MWKNNSAARLIHAAFILSSLKKKNILKTFLFSPAPQMRVMRCIRGSSISAVYLTRARGPTILKQNKEDET